MSIEEAIQQKSWSSEKQKAEVNIIYTYFWIKERMGAALKSHGVTLQQYNVLRILRGQYPGGITTSDIRSRMLDKMSDASRLVDRLEKHQFVEKKTNTKDRRLVCVTITEAGLELLKKVDKQGQLHVEENQLNNDEAMLLNKLLNKLRNEDQ